MISVMNITDAETKYLECGSCGGKEKIKHITINRYSSFTNVINLCEKCIAELIMKAVAK